MEINLSINDDQLRSVFSTFERPTKPLMNEIAAYLVDEAVKAFKNETSPDGSKWAALNPKYKERKSALYSGSGKAKNRPAKNKILQYTGTLADSISFAATDDTAILKTNRPVSGGYDLGSIHQFGAPRRNIPARPFFPVTDDGDLLPDAVDEINSLAANYFSI